MSRPGSAQARPIPLQDRIGAAPQIRIATGLETAHYYYGLEPITWSPHGLRPGPDGGARLALGLAQKRGKQDDVVKRCKTPRADGDPARRRSVLWDWYYLQLVRQDYTEIFEAARALAGPPADRPAALWAS